MADSRTDYIVFCDFDGTITNWESAEGLWEYYLGSQFHQKMKQLIREDATTSCGIKQLFHMIPSSRYGEMFDYIKTIELRPGFGSFLDYLDAQDIPLVVISGGIGEMITHVLKPYYGRLAGCHFCTLSTAQEYLTISSPYDDGIDLIRKERVMEEYSYQTSIFFGDSFTDRNASQSADIVFARDRLHLFLEERSIPHHSFDTFHDAVRIFKKMGYTNRTSSGIPSGPSIR